MIHQLETVRLGHFECKSGRLVISDPCYTLSHGANILRAKKGKWIAEIVTSDHGTWGERVSVLKAHHVDHPYDNAVDEAPFTVGVDSGQAGIFDKPVFKNDKAIPKDFKHQYKEGAICEDEPWYSYICDHTLRDNRGGDVVNGGVVSRSGFGDGGYECLLAKDDKKQLVGIQIVFIPEEEDDEDEYDEGFWYYDQAHEED